MLAYLNVPQDVPVAARNLHESNQHGQESNLTDVTDFNPVQSETAGPSESPVSDTQEPAAGTPAPTVEFAEGEGILVPELEGKAVREVTEECTKLGLNPVLVGTGIAIEQSPGAGATIRRGSRITVQFARGVFASSAAHRRGDR